MPYMTYSPVTGRTIYLPWYLAGQFWLKRLACSRFLKLSSVIYQVSPENWMAPILLVFWKAVRTFMLSDLFLWILEVSGIFWKNRYIKGTLQILFDNFCYQKVFISSLMICECNNSSIYFIVRFIIVTGFCMCVVYVYSRWCCWRHLGATIQKLKA